MRAGVNAVRKNNLILLVTWMFLQTSGQAQSGPAVTRLGENNEIPSSLVAALPSQPRTAREPFRSAPTQQFVCSASFTLEQCNQDMLVVRKALARYQASDLGEWTWVLVRSEEWKLISLARNINPRVAALTALGVRTTFFEEALVDGPSGRVSELMDLWHLGRDRLLDLAVRHELGHALCNNASEWKADRVARLLEQRKQVSCETNTGAKQK